MDIVTQGLLGATVAQAGARSDEVRLASIVGFISPLLADADALIQSIEDPLLFLEYHRHFTHSFMFIPFGALLASLLLWPFFKKKLSPKRIYFFSLLGYATAGILDACTSYGTHLLWPFNNDRVAWSIISIFDPAFSLALIAVIAFGVLKCKPLAGRIGLLFAAAYLSLGAIQHDRAETMANSLAQQRGHIAERLVVKPTIGNLLLWRSIYRADGLYYVDAVRVSLPGEGKIFRGDSLPAFDIKQDLPKLNESMTTYRDIRRFELFSDGYLVWHPEHSDVLGDIRYAMVPTSTKPLWGIKLNFDEANGRVTFNTYRSRSETGREIFLSMLLD
ncbi:MAG: metal-dependent hydrolase [Calditrichaeota bacterium]|nr:MAG: metal-dependent hydrolase [Calditrichota bacterium]MBL1205598.1 metal-dependent hydrolase [Calditrichota bacterium]NOG45427.1 metal-dependent hydrolase [Calditrichota bacterium]